MLASLFWGADLLRPRYGLSHGADGIPVMLRAMSVPSAPVVLLTGASSGVGLALARQLQTLPFRLVLTARERSLGKLREQLPESHSCMVRALDVTHPDERLRVVREAEERFGGIDILVNNAGMSFRAVVEDMTEEDELLQLSTNFLGPMELVRLVLPKMRAKRSGRIINVSSVGGMMAMPTMGSSSASKCALEGASESLWYELKPWGIGVSLVQPGFVHSNAFRRVAWGRRLAGQPGREAYEPYYVNMSRFVERLMGLAWATPESIAAVVLRTMTSRNPPLRVPATIDAHFFSMLRRFLPRRIYHAILYAGLPGVREWGRVKSAPQARGTADVPLRKAGERGGP